MSRRGHYKMLTLKSKGMDEGTLQKCQQKKTGLTQSHTTF